MCENVPQNEGFVITRLSFKISCANNDSGNLKQQYCIYLDWTEI